MANSESLDYKFAASTSMHGVARVADNSRFSVRIIWIMIVLACFGVCIWQISLRIIAYTEYNTNTEISINYPGRVEFPAVTFCNFNRYTQSLLDQYVNDSWALSLYLQLANSKLLNAHISFLEHYGITLEKLQSELDRYFPNGLDVEDVTRTTGWQLNIIECLWNGHRCDEKNFIHTFTQFGNCFTFNGGDEYLEQRIPGNAHGLKLALHIQQDEYSESMFGNVEAGVKFMVHPKGEPPAMESQGYALQPGTRTFADIKQVRYISLEPPWGQCDRNAAVEYFTSYSLAGCLLEYSKRIIYKECGCRPLYMPGDEQVCSLSQSTTCVQRLVNNWTSKVIENPCAVSCNYSTYPMSLSYATIPNNNVAEQVEKYHSVTLEEIKDSYVFVDVYYSQIQYEQYTQTEAMTSSALLSDVGGQLGLFIGISVITLIEIFEYISKKIAGLCCKAKKVNSIDGELDEIQN